MKKRKKWFKYFGLTLLSLCLLGAVTGLVLYRRADRVPQWYQEARVVTDDPSVESRTTHRLQSWANKVSSGDPKTKSADERQFSVKLTAADINRLIEKWRKSVGLDEKMDRYVQDVRLRIADGNITIAGKVVEYDKVMSVVLIPQKDDSGYATLKLQTMKMGEQVIPLVALNDKQAKLIGSVAKQAKSVVNQLSIDERSIASRQTADLYYTSLASELFAGRTADAYTFVNRIVGFSFEDPLATRVRNIELGDGEVTLVLETLDAGGRLALVEKLKSVAEEAQPSE